MQMDKAQALKKSWGDKPCGHPEIDREYCLGAQTGDYVCTTCGETFMSSSGWRHAQAEFLKKTTNTRQPSQT